MKGAHGACGQGSGTGKGGGRTEGNVMHEGDFKTFAEQLNEKIHLFGCKKKTCRFLHNVHFS